MDGDGDLGSTTIQRSDLGSTTIQRSSLCEVLAQIVAMVRIRPASSPHVLKSHRTRSVSEQAY